MLAFHFVVCLAMAANVAATAIATNVLLISIDGMHQSDLEYYVKYYPNSAFASIVSKGVQFTKAHTPYPSDSFPGMVGIATGGNPSSTGVYYDDIWNNDLYPAGTTNCTNAKTGVEVTWTEEIDMQTTGASTTRTLDAGQGLVGLPGSILSMTGHPRTLMDATKLPVDPTTCKPMYPYQYLKVNTMFEVARESNMRTAWCDKHLAYDILNGPSGKGIQDLFTPEINSDAPIFGSKVDWTSNNTLTRQYDGYKVGAVLNQIKGYDHSGAQHVGTPAIFGMNFQSVSTAQKLPAIQSSVITGGYLADGNTPGPLLTGALKFVDSQLALLTAAIANSINNASTVIILTAKHGQSPKTPSALLRIDEGAIETALNAAWKVKKNVTPLVALTASDDGLQFWLYDRSVAAVQFTKNFLMSYKGTGTTLNSPFTAAYNSSGLVAAYAGDEVCNLYNVKCPDGRVPDVVGISAYGVIYTGKAKKIAEHGGFNTDDRNVLLVVSGSSLPVGNAGTTITSNVYTIQVAPTILTLLGLDPFRLAAVLIEKTQVLPISYSSVATATVNSPSVSSTSSPSVSSTKYVQTSTAYAGKSFAATLAGLSMTLSAFFFL